MAGNIRAKAGKRGSGRSEQDYVRARRRVISNSAICAECGDAIDTNLKPICRFVPTAGVPVQEAHLIPLTCGDDCVGHSRKPNPWSASADHVIPVADLPPDSPLLTSSKNLVATHLCCNQRKGAGKGGRARVKTSRDWFA